MPKDKPTSNACPLCGNRVSPGLEKCPVCGTPVKAVVEKATKPTQEKDRADDYLRKGLPQTALTSSAIKCPLCAKELEGKESKCPRCGIPLVSKAEMLECPECGALAPKDSKACPKCGIGFEEEAPEPSPRVKPAERAVPHSKPEIPPAPLRPPARPPVKEPEPAIVTVATRVESPPRTEGLVNGRGSASGTGFVNGTGLVNGTGMTNGTKFEVTEPTRARHQTSILRRWQFLAILIAILIIVPAFIYLSYSDSDGAVSVDGQFGDWSDTQKYTSYTTSVSSTVNIDEWAVQNVGPNLYLYVKVEGAVMWSSEVSSFYLFIDSDDLPSTGYSLAGIGANYLVELDGWDGEVGATALYRYEAGTSGDQLDWNKWFHLSSAQTAIDEDMIEAVVELPSEPGPDAKYLLVSQDASTHLSASYPVPASGGILVIAQEPGPGISASGTVPASSSLALVRLTLTCDGTGGTVTTITPTVAGGVPGAAMSGISIALGDTEYVTLAVDTSSSSAGTLVSAYVHPDDVTSNFDEVIVLGTPVSAYVASAPSSIQIDGAFGDWYGLTSLDGDSIPLVNPNIDIERVSAVNETAQSFFYVSVLGDICAGTYIPVIAAKPTSGGGGGGGTVILPRKAGEDILRIYIDSDLSIGTGYLISTSGKTIGADFRLEVRGVFGEIVSESVSSYSSGSWVAVTGADMDADNDLNELEVRVSAASISGAFMIDFVVEATDWNSRKDLATALPSGSRIVQTMVNAISPESWIIDGGTNAQATAMSYQRKLFYDGTNIWSFYWDGSNTIYKYTTDGGQTWSSGVRAFSTNAVNEVSVWYDAANSAVYAAGDTGAASQSLRVQKGTVSPSTHVITWQPTDSIISVSTQNLGGKNAYISLDASGYVWILSSNLSSLTPDVYHLTAWRSSSAGSTSSFLFSGNMITGGANAQPNVKGSIVPAGTGSDVWAVYIYSGSVYSRKYTGSWSTQSTIYANVANVQNQDLAPPVAVVDAAGVVHVVYGNGHEQPVGTCKPFIYYAYNTGATWSVPYRLDGAANSDGNFYPTISLDRATGSVYAFWVFWDAPTSSYTVVGKRNVSGTWTSITLPPQTTTVKQYLTSIYSAPAENFICFQWTQNTSAPIELQFERIPEFGNVVLPAFLIMIVCVVSMGLHRKRR